MPLEAERCESGSNGSRDWSRFCKALSEPKQGLDLLYSRGVVTFPKHRRGGMQFTKPQDRTSQNVGVAGGGTGSYLVILWCLPTAEGVDEWKWEGGSGDMAAHLRNRRPPPSGETWVTCGELGVTGPEQWGALGSALPPYSHIDFLPGLIAWGQVDRARGLGQAQTSGSEKNMRGTYSFHSINITKTYNTVVEGRIHSDPE